MLSGWDYDAQNPLYNLLTDNQLDNFLFWCWDESIFVKDQLVFQNTCPKGCTDNGKGKDDKCKQYEIKDLVTLECLVGKC
jgi:hypothetical protein